MRHAVGAWLLVLLAGLCWSGPAAADPCKGIEAAFLPACAPPRERDSDRAESDFWRKQQEKGTPAPFPTLPPPVPYAPGYIPSPLSPTKTGPMTLDDLKLRPDGKGGLVGSRPGYRFGIDRDGTIHFDDKPPVQMVAWLLPLGFVGIFDLTDIVMRLQGADPYTFDKFRVLELTEGMRSLMATEDRTLRIEQALSALPARLAGIWRDPNLTESERRALLFRLWDELLEPVAAAATSAGGETKVAGEPTTSGAPEEQAEAAALAGRRMIVDFVQRWLPAGSPHAFTPSELATLNARRISNARFAPYERATPAGSPSPGHDSP